MIKFLIFDVGGILFQGGPLNLVMQLSRSIVGDVAGEGDAEYLKYRPLLQTGKMKTKVFFEHLKEKFRLEKTVRQIQKVWLSVYKKYTYQDKAIIRLIHKLKKKYKVIGFSNTMDLHGEYNKRIGNYSVFDKIFLTYEMGYRKPDREAYEYVLKSLSAKPEECVFIDDRKENTAVAKNLGIKTSLFLNNKQLKEDLRRLKLL